MDDLTAAVSQAVADLDGVATVYLFGSRAKGTARPNSDYDFAVLFNAGVEPLARLNAVGEIQSRLARHFNAPTDVVDLNGSPDILASQVLKYGQPMVCCDERARVHFEVAARRRILDFEPYRGFYITRMLESMAGGNLGTLFISSFRALFRPGLITSPERRERPYQRAKVQRQKDLGRLPCR